MPEDKAPCRDFERGVCSRGGSCRYFHPEGMAPPEGTKLPICKDYQNKGCERWKCKFLHITKEEESVYDATGTLPELGVRDENVMRPAFVDKDVCNDFMKGKCERGTRCKFIHPSDSGFHGRDPSVDIHGKRPRIDAFYGGGGVNNALMEENDVLRQQITDLNQEVVNLKEMNDTLYVQNTRYCSQLQILGATTTSHSHGQVIYPKYTQTVYPLKAHGAAMGSHVVTDLSAFSYLHY